MRTVQSGSIIYGISVVFGCILGIIWFSMPSKIVTEPLDYGSASQAYNHKLVCVTYRRHGITS